MQFHLARKSYLVSSGLLWFTYLFLSFFDHSDVLLSDKLKAILEDNDCGQPTLSKPSRSSKSVTSNRVLLAQQKLSMLKALGEQSFQASVLPSNPPASVDSDEEPCLALRSSSSAADSRTSECIRLKFMAKTKQHVSFFLLFSFLPSVHQVSDS
jgi:hypothetical protein